jgi:hypothetical protein
MFFMAHNIKVKSTEEIYNEIRRNDPERQKRLIEHSYLRAKYKEEKKIRRNQAIFKAFTAVVYTPLSIIFRVASILTRVAGVITAIGFPYGVFCIYRLIQQHNESVSFSEMTHRFGAFAFVIFPFIAFFVSYFAGQLADYFAENA